MAHPNKSAETKFATDGKTHSQWQCMSQWDKMWYLFLLFIDTGNLHSDDIIEGHITKKSKNAICKEKPTIATWADSQTMLKIDL